MVFRLCCLASLLCMGLLAQITGSLTGLVRDPTGLPIQHVEVRIDAILTGVGRQASADERGR